MQCQEDELKLSPLPIAVFVVDPGANITSWNKACEKLAGYSAADIRGSPLERLITFDGDEGPAQALREGSDFEASGNLNCKDGSKVPVRITIDPDQQEEERLRPGMSVVVSIDTAAGNTQPH